MTDKIIALTTCEDAADAERIAQALVEQRLAACVNLVPNLRSIYRWQGKVESAGEVLLLIKSTRGLLELLGKELRRLHRYELPELIVLPVIDGSSEYLDWVGREVMHLADES